MKRHHRTHTLTLHTRTHTYTLDLPTLGLSVFNETKYYEVKKTDFTFFLSVAISLLLSSLMLLFFLFFFLLSFGLIAPAGGVAVR